MPGLSTSWNSRNSVPSRCSARQAISRLLTIALLVATAGFGALAQGASQGAPQDRLLRAQALTAPKSIDPIYATTLGENTLAMQLFEGLYTVDIRSQQILGQAESVEISSDGLRYTYRLRPGLLWSNGDPVTAQDFVLTFRRLVDPKYKAHAKATYLISALKGAADIVAGRAGLDTLGARALDDRTLEFELSAPTPFFPELLNAPALVPTPSRIYEKLGAAWVSGSEVVSNGAYVLETDQARNPSPYTSLKLRKNPNYREASGVHFERVIQQFDASRDEVASLAEGHLDVIAHYNGQRLEWVTQTLGANVMKGENYYTIYLAFNLNDPVVRDLRVRRALALVVDVEAITPRIDPLGLPAHSFSTPMPRAGWKPPDRAYSALTMPERLAQARALLREAGYSDERPLRLELVSNASTVSDRIAAAVKEAFGSIGVELGTTSVPGGQHYDNLTKGRFQVGRASWVQDIADPSDYLNLLQTGHVKNYARWSNPGYDALVAQLPTTLDTTGRTRIFRDMEALIEADVPLLPIYHGTFSTVVRKGLTGVVQHPQNILYRLLRPLGH